MKTHLLFLFPLLLLTGCLSGRVAPGHATASAGNVVAAVTQSQDPQAVTTQTVENDTVTRLCDPVAATVQGSVTPATSQIITSEHRKVTTTIGAAQKNVAQEIAAKLESFRWLQYFGLLVALFGLASLVYPPLKLIVASVTTSAACIASGAAMVFLPVVIVGHEVLILCLCAGAAALWFFAYRHGSISGQLALIKSDLQPTI